MYKLKQKKTSFLDLFYKKFKTLNYNTEDLTYCLKDKDSILKAATY